MKQITLIFIGLTAICLAGAVVTDFRADAGINKVELKWVVSAEQGIKGYRILRGLDTTKFQKIGFVTASGISGNERTYTFVDNTVFKTSDRTFYYKIEFVNHDGSENEFDKVISVSPQISSARQTWGSLKAMFR